MSSNLDFKHDRHEEPQPPALEIRYGQMGMVQLRLRTIDCGVVLDELTGRVATAPRFFERTAVCLDLTSLSPLPIAADVRRLIEAVRRAGMLPIAMTTGGADTEALAIELGLPLLQGIRAQPAAVPVVQPAQSVQPAPPVPPVPPVQAAAPAAEGQVAALIHTQPVRSGQRVSARGRDLVVTSTVGPGAELIADGCVHVYGALRGRAMAGARGQGTARIFCQAFHAELVSIAGVFRVFENIPPELEGKPAQAWLAGDALHVARLGQAGT